MPAIVGPFDLGTVVVRASVAIDPRTAQLTISSGSAVGGIPLEEGIPLDIRTLALRSIGRASSSTRPAARPGGRRHDRLGVGRGSGGVEPVSGRQLREPAVPAAAERTDARAVEQSRRPLPAPEDRLGAGPGEHRKVKLDLPKQLPSRLTTLQRACVASVFEADPAACTASSIVGTATVVTPMLAGALSGPAYLVSHGILAFPALVLVLQGDGVRIELEGQTNIHKGITSSTFEALPDVPIDTLDLVLPTGPHSAFAVNLPPKTRGGLCAQTLRMPTAITAQNGAQLKQTTRIGITGCPPTRAKPQRAKAKTKQR